MFSSYVKAACRNLRKNKTFAVINIAGLGVGIAVCLVIFTILKFELGFDGFHQNKDRIYRVVSERMDGSELRKSPGVPYPLPAILHAEMPELPASPVMQETNVQIIVPEEDGQPVKKFREEEGLLFVEPVFFSLFDFALLSGDGKALSEPNRAIIDQQTAVKYYGDWRSAVGKTFTKNNKEVFTVVGVMKDMPENTDLHTSILLSYATQKSLIRSTDWHSLASNYNCYLLLPEGQSPERLSGQLTAILRKYYKESTSRDLQLLQPLTDVHYNTDIKNFTGRTVSYQLINTLRSIAAFILLIACVNFINLCSAQALNRSREVGVRKVLGGSKAQIRMQFYGETIMISLLAGIFALLLTSAVLPFVSGLLDLPLEISELFRPPVLLALTGIIFLVVAVAGFYPALVLSRFNPITALKTKLVSHSANGLSVRRGLVVFQFLIAQVLIIGMLIIVKQMSYFRNHSLGFNKEAVVNFSIPADSAGHSRIDFLRSEVSAIRGVADLSFSFGSPADIGNWNSNFKFDHAATETSWFANLKWADDQYLKTYGIELLAGRNLFPSDTVQEFLVNETLVRQLGIADPAQALNKEIVIWDEMKGKIVGVVKDFNALSLHKGFVPVLLSTFKLTYRKAGIRLQTDNMKATLDQIRGLWNRTYPDFVFEEQFLDAKVESFYAQENRLANLYKIFAGLAIFLSCLGLYGLASFMAVQRIKEVGIRKVLGASPAGIVYLFSREFLLLIGIAFVVAVPVAVYFMNNWLQDFAYRIDISWSLLLLSGLLAMLVALLTVSVKALKAALANPVRSLRSE